MRAALKAIQAAAGNAGEAVYVDDVFSTYVYAGNSSTNQIDNGIDLAGEGGLIWLKKRSGGTTGADHSLIDTERGRLVRLKSNTTDANLSFDQLDSFNSDGFTLSGSGEKANLSGKDYVSWTFRKQPGFFDVVTWSGDGTTNRQISHNLGSVPGCIIVKRYDSSDDWKVYHVGADATAPEDYVLELNATGARLDSISAWNDTAPTKNNFTVNSGGSWNASGGTYVAYLFATGTDSDSQIFGDDSDESIIKCGSYTTNASAEAIVDLGFEPQWVLFKKTNSNGNWVILDNMRGWAMGDGRTGPSNDAMLFPNASFAENVQAAGEITPTGFRVELNANIANGGDTYAYVAIRRPHKPASEFAATDLFSPNATASATGTEVSTNFPIDMQIINLRSVVDFRNGSVNDRLRGVSSTSTETANYLITNSTSAESTSGSNQTRYWDNTGFQIPSFISTNSTIFWNFRRAPGFFDVVAYTGNSSVRNVPHNLGAVPEMMIFKRRDVTADWAVYHSEMGNDKALALNTDYSYSIATAQFNSTTPTDSVFTVGNFSTTNNNGNDYIAYLFASVPGISKVGGYTGTGSDLNVDCGFTSGARFVLIKRWDRIGGSFGVNGDWYVWDSVRGIVAGNDPYLLLNSTAAEVTSTDYIDPLSSGFTITSSAPAALNASGGTYIFLAIA